MLIFIEDFKLKRQFRKFKTLGVIPEAIYAGDSIPQHNEHFDTARYARYYLKQEADINFRQLQTRLITTTNQFKYPYTMGKYKRSINPISALYQEYERAKFAHTKDKFDLWIIEECIARRKEIVDSLRHDCREIIHYLKIYKSVKNDNVVFLKEELNKLLQYLEYFKNLH